MAGLLAPLGVHAEPASDAARTQVANIEPARLPVARPDRSSDSDQPQADGELPEPLLPPEVTHNATGVLSDEAIGAPLDPAYDYSPVLAGSLAAGRLSQEAIGIVIKEAKVAVEPGRKKLFVIADEKAFVAEVCEKIETSAQSNNLPPGFLAKLIWTESWFDPNAISPKGAEGIAQFMPYTAATWGLENSFDPLAAINASARLLGYLNRGYGNLGLAAAAYNAGEGRVNSWRAGRSGLPRETRGYVYSITGHGADLWKRGNGPDVSFALDESRPFQTACREMPVNKAPLQRYFANTYFNRALRKARKGNLDDAAVLYSVAIRLKATFPIAYNNRGIVYRQLGDYESAIANYDTAIKQKPDYAAAYNNRGYAYVGVGRYEDAIADYNTAIKLQPGYIAAYYNRGFAEARLGRIEKAIKDYTHAIKAQPKHAAAHYNRALAYLSSGDTKSARKDFDRAIAANGKFAAAYYRRAMLLIKLGNSQAARADYQKSVALDSRFAHERYKLFD